ncbi:hypothetical protein ACJMK2_023542, partial [Sinanodonta woodiana]
SADSLICWQCISDDCANDPSDNYKASKKMCSVGQSCQKVRFEMYSPTDKRKYFSTVRGCATNCESKNDFENCTSELFSSRAQTYQTQTYQTKTNPKLIKTKLIKRKLIKPKLIKRKLIKPKLIKRKLIKTNIIKPQKIKYRLMKHGALWIFVFKSFLMLVLSQSILKRNSLPDPKIHTFGQEINDVLCIV